MSKSWRVSFFINLISCFCLAIGLLPSASAEVVENESCFTCHGDPASNPFIDSQKYEHSIHGDHRCIRCHSDITQVPHDLPLAPVSCSACHHLESQMFLNSDHGQALKAGISEAASCKSCHGDSHELLDYRNQESPVYRFNIPAMCGTCHENTESMKKFHLSQGAPVYSYSHSVHGLALQKGAVASAVCTDCHGSHNMHKATNPSSKLYWQNIPETCGKCHENVKLIYLESIHGKAMAAGKREAPVCTDCHGEHTIDAIKLSTSKVFPSHIPETCGQCHDAERITTKYQLPPHAVETYMESFHGLAMRLGSVTAANCASCHGAHDILPYNDPRSSVHPNNLPQTCGKCHTGVGAQVTQGQIHSGTRPGMEHLAVAFVRRFYILLMILVLGGMFLHNCFDFFKKLRAHYLKMSQMGARLRMNFNERLQHGILAITFIILAYTGFALKYPQAWWAAPFVGRIDWRGLGHRAAALIFCILALYHVGFLLFTKRGRWQLKALIPRRHDFIQFFQMFNYLRGKRPNRPVFGFYSYIEKIEYWALVWGSMVMVVTGILMINEGWFLGIFPKWFFDVVTAVHFYEAILASLAIILWHGYFVMFDPDEYPMKWTWINGRNSPSDMEHREDN